MKFLYRGSPVGESFIRIVYFLSKLQGGIMLANVDWKSNLTMQESTTNPLSNRGVHAVVESHGCVRRHWAWVLVPLIPRDGQIYQKNVTTKIWWKELGKGGMTRRGKCPMESWTPYERIPRSIALQSIPICS